MAILRPENWLMGLFLNLRFLQKGNGLIPRVTLLPQPSLAPRLQNWLQQDWETSMPVVNQLLAYTLQFIPIVQSINRVLAFTSLEEIIWRVSRLAEAPFDWQLVRFASASLNNTLISEGLEQLWFLPWRRRWRSHLVTDTQLNTPARATAAGFWYLHEKNQPKQRRLLKSCVLFSMVRKCLPSPEL